MGHGLAALLLGGHFQQLKISPNGSGVAYYSGGLFLEPIGSALVAVAEPLGPPIAGAILILVSRRDLALRAATRGASLHSDSYGKISKAVERVDLRGQLLSKHYVYLLVYLKKVA
ncbi:MAG: M50 family metallopeptidase [Stigonema ocellatum SAG 48.90 = DSM 106950]|nr:M50 family metallopeptidase [Stigonema ocellatum SAG 48.90 = DSM 106950]